VAFGVSFPHPSSSGEYWLVGHSLAYFIFGMAIVLEIVHRQLPRMSQTKAGALAYFGIYAPATKHSNDVSGTPHFILGYLSLMYLMLLLAYIFNEISSSSSTGFARVRDPCAVLIASMRCVASVCSLMSVAHVSSQLYATDCHRWHGFPGVGVWCCRSAGTAHYCHGIRHHSCLLP
jgi:hypothetical protein